MTDPKFLWRVGMTTSLSARDAVSALFEGNSEAVTVFETEENSGHWRVVTGKIESNETAWGAALRELTEETGFRNASLFAVPYVNQFYEWQHDRINAIPVFVAVVEHGAKPTLNEEHIDSRWIDVDQAVSILSWPGQREGLRAAHAMLSGYHPEIDTLEIRK